MVDFPLGGETTCDSCCGAQSGEKDGCVLGIFRGPLGGV